MLCFNLLTRDCTGCGEVKNVKLFGFHPTGKYLRQPKCRTCVAGRVYIYYQDNPKLKKQADKRYREKNKEEKLKHRRDAYHRKYRYSMYGLTSEDFIHIKEQQNNCCAICGKSGEEKPLVFDYDHTTNKFRALLCDDCNRGLGSFKDNRDVMNKAIEYLTKHQS